MNKGYECTDWYFCTMSLYPGPVRRTYAANRTFTAGDFPRRFFLRGIYTSILLLTTILIIYNIQLPSSKPEGASCTSVFAKGSPTTKSVAWFIIVACPRCASFATNSACPPNVVVAPAARKTCSRKPSPNARDARRTPHSPQPPDSRSARDRSARTAIHTCPARLFP